MREDHKTRISTREKLYKDQNGICIYCGKHITIDKASLDHIIPVLHLEENLGESNLVMCCKRCNKLKDNMIVFSNLYDRIIYPILEHKYVYQDYYIHSTTKIRKSY